MILIMVYKSTQFILVSTLRFYFISILISFYISSTIIEWNIINISSCHISIPIILDPIRTIFITTVITIATRVIQFSKTYIKEDKTHDRFIVLVLIFVTSIICLILFPHLIILLLGWDGLGITSFILVIYYNNAKRLGAGIITALTNRIGDVMILISIAAMFNQGQWIININWYKETPWWVTILIIIAAITKRAQIPFSSWLPAAMAAPTPVRALVHSSTLVTAGVFLIYRFFPIIETWEYFKPIIIFISTTTILIASIRAIAECDIKKIIALSTLRQVAIIIFTLRIGLPDIAIFHLITHAIFKALLFICAGNIIDIHHHRQDLRLIGNTSKQLPLISSAILIANLALCGAPFMAGFYSKDLIIETRSILSLIKNITIFTIFITATTLTTAYTTRLSLYTMMGPTNSPTTQYSTESKPQILSAIPLTLIAISAGALINWTIISPLIEPNFNSHIKLIAPVIVITGLIIGIMLYLTKNKNKNPPHMLYLIWFLTPLSSQITTKYLIKAPLLTLKEIDHGWSILPHLIFNKSQIYAKKTLTSQNNSVISNINTIAIIILWIIIARCSGSLTFKAIHWNRINDTCPWAICAYSITLIPLPFTQKIHLMLNTDYNLLKYWLWKLKIGNTVIWLQLRM